MSPSQYDVLEEKPFAAERCWAEKFQPSFCQTSFCHKRYDTAVNLSSAAGRCEITSKWQRVARQNRCLSTHVVDKLTSDEHSAVQVFVHGDISPFA